MRDDRWQTAVMAATLVVAIVLGFLAWFPTPADATCFPWEYQERWVTVSYEGCCDALLNGGLFKQKLERRYRVPSCEWGPWQDTGVTRYICRLQACRFEA